MAYVKFRYPKSYQVDAGLKPGVFFNTLIWLVVLAVGFFLYSFIRKLFPGGTPLAPLTSSMEKDVADRSSDRLFNGDTYLQAAGWLYREMYGDTFIGWFKNSDEDLIGSYLLTIRKEEYKQLELTYALYKKDHGTWQVAALKDSLSGDLRDLFSSSNQKKYLSHLGIL